jgi:nucleoside-diphosphate-sugar epimerase
VRLNALCEQREWDIPGYSGDIVPIYFDSSKIRQELGWKPPFTMEEGLKETTEWFKQQF